jgi:hypothetical protein
MRASCDLVWNGGVYDRTRGVYDRRTQRVWHEIAGSEELVCNSG